jgi:hypothetical protein
VTASDLAPVPEVRAPGRAALGARLRQQHLAGTRRLATNGGALIANVFVSGLTGLFFWILAARVAAPDVVANATAMVTAVIAVVSLTQQSFVFTLPSLLATAPRPQRLARRVYGLALVLTGIAAPVYVLVGPAVADGLDYLREPHLAAAFVIGCLGWCLFSLQDAVLTGVRKGAVVLLENGLWGVARLAVLGLAWAVGLRIGIGWLLAAWIVPAVALVAGVSWYLFVNARSPLAVVTGGTSRFDRRRLLSFMGAEYAASVLSSVVQLVAGAYALTVLGAATAAPLLAAASLVIVVEGAVAAFAQALAVEAAQQDGTDAHRRNLLLVAAVLIGGVSVVAVVGSFLAGEQVMALLGPHYREAGATALAILMLCVLPRGIIVVSNADNRLRGDGMRNLVQQVVAAAVFFGLLLTGAVDTVANIAWSLFAMRAAASVVAVVQLRQGGLRMASAA